MKGMTIMFVVMILSLGIASLWSSIPAIKDGVHSSLDPTLGILMNWNVTLGLIIITGVLTFLMTLLQKYATDQNLLKEIKDEQKIVQQEMKTYKEHPEKKMELSKKSMELMMKSMPITMRTVLYTMVPFILLIRWFGDYFIANPVRIWFLSGIWAYIVFSIMWSMILRKVMKVH